MTAAIEAGTTSRTASVNTKEMRRILGSSFLGSANRVLRLQRNHGCSRPAARMAKPPAPTKVPAAGSSAGLPRMTGTGSSSARPRFKSIGVRAETIQSVKPRVFLEGVLVGNSG